MKRTLFYANALLVVLLMLWACTNIPLLDYNGNDDDDDDEEIIHNLPTGTVGDVLWSYSLTDPTYTFSGHPAFDESRQTLYVAAKPINSGQGKNMKLYAIHGNGTLKWETNPTQSMEGGSPVLGQDGVVYFASNRVMYAYEPSDGQIFWTYTVEDRPINSISYHPGRKLILLCGGEMAGISIVGEDGVGIDNTLLGEVDEYRGLTIMPDNSLITQLRGQSFEDGKWIWNNWLLRTSIDLEQIWRYYLDDYQLTDSYIAVDNSSNAFIPLMANGQKSKVELIQANKAKAWYHEFGIDDDIEGTIVGPQGYFITHNTKQGIIIFSGNGSVVSGPLPHSVSTSSMVVDVQGNFYANLNETDNFAAFDASGVIKWKKSFSWIDSSPVIANNGVILVVGSNRITAIQGYARLSSTYARQRGDNRNTGRGAY